VPDPPLLVVLDTNVLIAALAKPGGSAARVIDAWERGRLEVVASEATIGEAELVLDSGWLRRLVSGERVASLLSRLRTRSTLVDGTPLKGLPLKDSGDRRLVEAAVEGHADYLVTADVEVLRYRGYSGTEFVTPAELLRLLAP
jgi:putative PIN family toxin of toxin-antitoxin system